VPDDLVAHPNTTYVLMGEQRVEVKLPAPLVRVLNSVSILHYEGALATQQATDLLPVSHPYLIRLL